MDALGISHVDKGILEICRGGRCGRGCQHWGVFAFLGFKISDLVHTFGEFDDVQPLRKGLEVEDVGGGIPFSHQVLLHLKSLKKVGAYTLGEFVKYCLSKI